MNFYLPNGLCKPGYRFAPTTHELVMWYLRRKVLGETRYLEPVVQIDIYEYDPWELQNMAFELAREELMWYFFCPEKKYGRGNKNSRTTRSGYWKGTGEHKDIMYAENLVAKRKTLVFHEGKSPAGLRTDWVMHQFCLQDKELEAQGINQESFILCRVFRKPEQGPQNGAEYGAPFRMDMWEGLYRSREAHPDLDIQANAATADNQTYFDVVNPNNAENAFGAINSDGTAFTGYSSLSYGNPLVPQSFASKQIYPGAELGVIDHTRCLVSSAPAVYSHPSTSEQVDTGAESDVIDHTSCLASSPLAGYIHPPTYEQNYFAAELCAIDHTGSLAPSSPAAVHASTCQQVYAGAESGVIDHTSSLASSSSAVYTHPSTSLEVYAGAPSVVDHTSSLAASSPAVYTHPSTSKQFYTGAVTSATGQTSLSSSAPSLSYRFTSDFEVALRGIKQTPPPTLAPKVDDDGTKFEKPVIPSDDAFEDFMDASMLFGLSTAELDGDTGDTLRPKSVIHSDDAYEVFMDMDRHLGLSTADLDGDTGDTSSWYHV